MGESYNMVGVWVEAIIAILCCGMIFHLIVFLLVSLGMLIFARPSMKRYISSIRTRRTYKGIIGKVVRVSQDVDNTVGGGCVVVNGQDWTVQAADDRNKIVAGSLVKIVDCKGFKLIVEKCGEG